MASESDSATRDTTREFLRSFSVIEETEPDSAFDELSPIPETPGEDITDSSEQHDHKLIPYTAMYKPPVPFSKQRENCWIPGVPIHVTVEKFDRLSSSTKILNPNLYTIRVKHGDYEWTIRRRYKHFKQLHDSLALFRTKYKIPLPNKDYHEKREDIRKDIKDLKQRQQQKAVRFPTRPEAMVREENIPERMKQLEEYLQNLLTCKSYRNNPDTMKFFEVSHLSFVNKLGVKSKEGLVKKCSGGRRINIQCCGCLQDLHLAGTWNKRWLVVKDNFVLYVRPEDGLVSDVMLMDSAFSVKYGMSNTGAKHGLLLENYSRRLLIKCWTSRKAKEWADSVLSVARRFAGDYIDRNRFGSFAPARENVYARWFVDGKSYFEAVADALEKAKEEIFITDWWLSPEIYLKRPIVDGNKWRLDVVLRRKAEAGVKIFVLLYKEIEAALGIRSIYSKQTLVSHCPENIRVIRHPDHIPGKGVLLWAHHEKMVVIDQQIAFTGGLDLCYGRWDDDHHKMTDLGSISFEARSQTMSYGSDSNAYKDYASHTDMSVVTDDNLSGTHGTGPWEVVSKNPPKEDKKKEDDSREGEGENSKEEDARASASQSDVSSQPKKQEGSDDQEEKRGDGDNFDEEKTARDKKSREENSGSGENSDGEDTAGGKNSKQEKPESDKKSSEASNSQHSKTTDTSKHSKSSHPIDANVLVNVTNASDDDDNEDDNSNGYYDHSDEDDVSRCSSEKNTAAEGGEHDPSKEKQYGKPKLTKGGPSAKKSKAPGEIEGQGNKDLMRQSSIVDTEGFSESAIKEINESMQPFKNIHSSDYPQARGGASYGGASPEHVNIGFDDSIDKEIVCSPDAKEAPPKSGKGGKSKGDGKGSKSSKKDDGSHLWGRRTKDKSLKLVVPEKNGSYKKTADSGGGDDDMPGRHKDGEEEGTDTKLRANSDSSEASRASNSELINNEKPSTSSHKEDKDGNEPTSTTSGGSASKFANAASAMNVFKKLMHRKEENNNQDDDKDSTGKNDKSKAARRRWKMVFNVSKFETMVRDPHVPERVDESLFYNQNIKHPKTKEGRTRRLMDSLMEGVDKLTRQGRRGSNDSDENRDSTYFAGQEKYPRTKSEEDILENDFTGSSKLWIGKDYVNFVYKDFVSLEQPFEDFIDRTKCPRMPWHDIGCVLYGKPARDLARHFIGRWNFTKLEKFKKNPDFPLLIPKTSVHVPIPNALRDITFEVKAQILRSSCGWSAGLAETEYSIHEAYEHCIENARDYIYIENQFFITHVGNSNTVFNGVGNALFKRIMRAHRSSSDFKVYVVMPLMPAFEGEFGTNTGAALQAVTHWNYTSICRGPYSLMERLAKEIPDPNKYIVFCGLRTWDRLNGKLMTELIYVHSKLMIVDDDTVIIGSANINDRSLLGSRDSEIAVMFEDIHKVDVMVNGKQYKAGKFASSLRWTIFREHLGVQDDPEFVDLTDITSDSFYKEIWIKRAAVNTTCFDKVFNCIPSDSVTNFAELRKYQTEKTLAETNDDEAMTWLNKVKGYLVLVPLQFLRQESLTPKVGQKEHLLPTYLWT